MNEESPDSATVTYNIPTSTVADRIQIDYGGATLWYYAHEDAAQRSWSAQRERQINPIHPRIGDGILSQAAQQSTYTTLTFDERYWNAIWTTADSSAWTPRPDRYFNYGTPGNAVPANLEEGFRNPDYIAAVDPYDIEEPKDPKEVPNFLRLIKIKN